MAFSTAGILKNVNISEGDAVQQGSVIAELEDAAYQRELESAQRNLNEFTSPAAIAEAEKSLADARQELQDQQDKVNGLKFKRASEDLIKKTQAEIDLSRELLARASDAYRMVARLEDGDSRKAQALLALTSAQMKLNNLVSLMNWYNGKPTDIDSALQTAKFDLATAAVQEFEWYLSAIKGETLPATATGSNLVQFEAAKMAVAVAQDKLDHCRLISPISGIAVKVNATQGEFVVPGQVLFIISDSTHLHVETTDLSEMDIPGVTVGQKVDVNVKALNLNLEGHVTGISTVADTLGGDVVYKTIIALDSSPQSLRAGMSVDVRFLGQ